MSLKILIVNKVVFFIYLGVRMKSLNKKVCKEYKNMLSKLWMINKIIWWKWFKNLIGMSCFVLMLKLFILRVKKKFMGKN